MDKKTLSESDICAKYITPAIIAAGWDEALQIRKIKSWDSSKHSNADSSFKSDV